MKKLNQTNKNLMLQNIPKLIIEKKFNRRELHSLYILYKALVQISSLRTKNFSDFYIY